MLKKREKKGFTLAELLIVIAIIAILIAIAVPVFSSSMQRANEATDCANIRALKAAAVAYYLDQEAAGTFAATDLVLDSDGQAKKSADATNAIKYKLDASKNKQLTTLGVSGNWSAGAAVTCNVDANGAVTFK